MCLPALLPIQLASQQASESKSKQVIDHFGKQPASQAARHKPASQQTRKPFSQPTATSHSASLDNVLFDCAYMIGRLATNTKIVIGVSPPPETAERRFYFILIGH
jgi:hypothetical protein